MLASPAPAVTGAVLAIEWAHHDLITGVSICGKWSQLNTIYATHMVYLEDNERTLKGQILVGIG
jgi:hypothetical protein